MRGISIPPPPPGEPALASPVVVASCCGGSCQANTAPQAPPCCLSFLSASQAAPDGLKWGASPPNPLFVAVAPSRFAPGCALSRPKKPAKSNKTPKASFRSRACKPRRSALSGRSGPVVFPLSRALFPFPWCRRLRCAASQALQSLPLRPVLEGVFFLFFGFSFFSGLGPWGWCNVLFSFFALTCGACCRVGRCGAGCTMVAPGGGLCAGGWCVALAGSRLWALVFRGGAGGGLRQLWRCRGVRRCLGRLVRLLAGTAPPGVRWPGVVGSVGAGAFPRHGSGCAHWWWFAVVGVPWVAGCLRLWVPVSFHLAGRRWWVGLPGCWCARVARWWWVAPQVRMLLFSILCRHHWCCVCQRSGGAGQAPAGCPQCSRCRRITPLVARCSGGQVVRHRCRSRRGCVGARLRWWPQPTPGWWRFSAPPPRAVRRWPAAWQPVAVCRLWRSRLVSTGSSSRS